MVSAELCLQLHHLGIDGWQDSRVMTRLVVPCIDDLILFYR